MRTSPQVLAAVLLCAGLIAVAFAMVPDESAVNPSASVRSIAASPAGFFVNSRKSSEHFREQIIRNPKVVSNYTGLAQLQLQLASETGDELRYTPEATRLIAAALKLDPTDFSARVLEASLLNKLHRFDEARDKLTELIAEYPDNSFLHGLRVDALVELGEYEAAVAESDIMQRLKPGLPSYSRAAYLRELHGDNIGAIAAMEMAVRAGSVGSPDRSWALYQLALLNLKEGNTSATSDILNSLLDEAPNYTLAHAGLASVALAEERYADARAIAQGGFDASGRVVFLELGLEAAQANNESGTADMIDQIHASFHASAEIGENIDMEYADFLADHNLNLDDAARRIDREIERRPNHLHVIETSAWVQHKRGESIQALSTVQRAMRLGTRDAKLYYRASQIATAANRPDLAAEWERAALSFNLKTESIGSWRELVPAS